MLLLIVAALCAFMNGATGIRIEIEPESERCVKTAILRSSDVVDLSFDVLDPPDAPLDAIEVTHVDFVLKTPSNRVEHTEKNTKSYTHVFVANEEGRRSACFANGDAYASRTVRLTVKSGYDASDTSDLAELKDLPSFKLLERELRAIERNTHRAWEAEADMRSSNHSVLTRTFLTFVTMCVTAVGFSWYQYVSLTRFLRQKKIA